MHRCRTLFIMLLLAVSISQVSFTATDQMVVQKMNRMPLAFTKNMGQWDDRVLFRTSAGGATMWFTKEGVTYQFTRRIPSPPSPLPAGEGWSKTGERAVPFDRFDDTRDSIEQLILTAKFVGANPNPEVVGEGHMEYKCSYFLGNDPTKWHTDVPNSKAVVYKGIYPGIDLKYYGNGDGKLEYDFIVAPGADMAQIKVEYEGAEEVCVDDAGQLVVETKWGKVTERIPLVYQSTADKLTAEYVVLDDNTFGFHMTDGYQQALALVIDPILSYGTYLGGTRAENSADIDVDDSGCVYVVGNTLSSDFPISNPYDPTWNDTNDVFVTKLSQSGRSLIYSTYIGGLGRDFGYRLALDQSRCAYVTGFTRSPDFPIQLAYDSFFGGTTDAFVLKLSPEGNSLIYSTFLGGSEGDDGQDIAVNWLGAAYVAGLTYSTDFPTRNAYDSTYNGGGWDAFVAKLSPAGGTLEYGTYLGGSGQEGNASLAMDQFGCAYVSGPTSSPDFPVKCALDNPFTGGDLFITKLSTTDGTLFYSTYLGGGAFETVCAMATDPQGCVYICGYTVSSDFPTKNAFDSSFNGGELDAYVTKLCVAGNCETYLDYSTFLGGSGHDQVWGLAVDNQRCAHVVGPTASLDFPMVDPFDSVYHGNEDAFYSKLSASGSVLLRSTFFGGGGIDFGHEVAVDDSGCVYIACSTQSSHLPTRSGFDSTFNGDSDGFVLKLCDGKCGDADANGFVNISDAVYLINYIFGGGPAPNPEAAGDVDCNGFVNISDAVYLINYIFGGGPEPCAGCR